MTFEEWIEEQDVDYDYCLDYDYFNQPHLAIEEIKNLMKMAWEQGRKTGGKTKT